MRSADTARVPYPGLRPFEAEEADLFFGRELHVDALLKRLSGSHFVAVVGESGSGKSSLVRAGLLPALEAGFVVEAGSDWRVAVMRPGGAPLAALASALLTPGVLSPAGGTTHCEFALAELRRGPLGLVQLVRDAHLDPHCNTLIVVDQFEELFRYGREPAQKDQANVFVELLLRASQQRLVPIFVVLTMRSDFVGDCARFRGLPELLNDNQYLTPRLTRDQIAAAVRDPARVCGGTVDQALVDELCNAVGDDPDQLPLLQHLLMRVWDRAKEQSNPPRLTSDLSREMGGLRSALNNHAQQIYDSLSGERQAIARGMFKSLTDPRSQRRDLRRDALVSEVAAVAAAGVDATIAVADEFRGEGRHMLMPPPTVPLEATSRLDISHESLLRQWSTLAEWAAEEAANAREFDRLREEAQREREQRGELLSGRDLARALDWIRQAEPTPAWVERYAPSGELDATLTFIRRSEAEAKRRKDEELLAAKREADAKRARYYSWISGGAVVLAGLVAIVMFNLWRRAEHDRRDAETQGKEAVRQETLAKAYATQATKFSLDVEKQNQLVKQQNLDLEREGAEAHTSQLAANARQALTPDASLAVLLARAALLEGGSDPAALRAMRDAIAAHVPSVEAPFPAAKSTTYIPGTNKVSWLDFSLSPASLSPLDDLVITPSGNHAIIWSAVSGRTIRTLPGRAAIVGSASFSPNGRLAVTTSADHFAQVWDVATGRLTRTLPHEKLVNRAVFNRTGTLLITLGDDEVAKIWTVGDAAAPPCELKHSGNFILATFSQDEGLLATVTHDDGAWEAQVWDIARGRCPTVPVAVPLLEKTENVRWASFSERGDWLGIVTVEGETIVLSVPDWKEQSRLVPEVRYESEDASSAGGGPSGLPPLHAWSHDGRYLAAAGGDNTVYIARIASADRPIALRGHTGGVTSIAFSPADDMLLTTSKDSTARIWTLGADKQVLERLVLSGHKDMVGSGAFSAKGDRLVTASDDGTVRSWTPLVALRERIFPGLRTASYSADGRQILASGISFVPGSRRRDGFWVAEMSATLASRRDDIKIRSQSQTFLGSRIIEEAPGGLSVRDLSEPGRVRLVGDSDHPRETLDGPSPRGRFAFAPAGFDSVLVWDLNTQAPPVKVVVPPGRTCTSDEKKKVPWEPQAISDERSVAWYCAEQDLVLITRVGQLPPIPIRVKDQSRVELIRFSTGGRLLALALEDYSVRVFESGTGTPRPPMKGHDGRIGGIDFSDDDRFLVSAGDDSTARVWDVASGAQIAMVATNGRQLTGAVFSPDGFSLLLLASDRALVWRCYACGDTPELLEEVRRRKIERRLSPEEERSYRITSDQLNAARAEPSQHSHIPHEGGRHY